MMSDPRDENRCNVSALARISRRGFLAGSANIDELDPRAEGLPVLRSSQDTPTLRTIMSNNFGFGGTNACVVFRRPQD